METPFSFGLGPDEPAITPQCDLWSAPLPVTRHAFGRSGAKHDFDARVTYGDYFSAARRFLQQDRLALLRKAVHRLTGRSVNAADVDRVAIFLVKHGAFYHPAYIEVHTCGRRLPLVLNVAASAQGKQLLSPEYRNIARLNEELAKPFWPLVFGQGFGLSDGGRRLPMFLGQWLEGFYEFHLTAGSDYGHTRVAVWDPGQVHRHLTTFQVQEALRQAAFILAYAYNPMTFEAILHWHLGAGDFVINPAANGLSVRLITVRKYAPWIASTEPGMADLLDGLLLYLVDISLRLRLDRLDGTGHLACHPNDVIPAICRGFFQGLDAAGAERGLPEDFIPAARQYLALHGAAELMPMALAVAARHQPHSDEAALLSELVAAHVATLAEGLTQSSQHPQHAEDPTMPSTI